MKEITIFIPFELKYYLQLFHILSKIYFYFDKINIQCNNNYFPLNLIIYNNLSNVNFIELKKDEKVKNSIYFENSQNFINQMNIFNFELIYNKKSILNRDITQENHFYLKLKENVTESYVFYFNYDSDRVINYFHDLYVFNPNHEFYDEEDDYFGKWVDLKTKNIIYYLKIIENASELHIYDLDMLFLILEIDVSHISNKYLYHHDILIKEEDSRLKDWNVIVY